jgi:hypothetical protein
VVHFLLFGGIIFGQPSRQLNSSREIYAVSASHNGSFIFFLSSMQKVYDGEVAANWLGK